MRIPGLTLLSGPAGGPVAGLAYADGQGFADCITCDMGGTSFDVALIKDGKPLTTTEGEINRLRISWPMLDVVTIGAGGGSIGWIDEVGLLRMGPQSAGADPGPACYGLGGTEPTCSDADLVLGYLDPDFFAGGRIKLDLDAARTAVEEKIAQAPGHDARGGRGRHVRGHQRGHGRGRARDRRQGRLRPPRLPAGDRRRRRSQPRLHDRPRPLHPRDPGAARRAPSSAPRACCARDLKHDFVRTYPITLDKLDWARFRAALRRDEGRRRRAPQLEEGIPDERITYHLQLDLRYIRQYHEVSVDIDLGRDRSRRRRAVIEQRFHAAHDALYGYSLEDRDTPVELINMRLTAIGNTEKPNLLPEDLRGRRPRARPSRACGAVYLPAEKTFAEVPVYDGFAPQVRQPLDRPVHHRAGEHHHLRHARVRRGGRRAWAPTPSTCASGAERCGPECWVRDARRAGCGPVGRGGGVMARNRRDGRGRSGSADVIVRTASPSTASWSPSCRSA